MKTLPDVESLKGFKMYPQDFEKVTDQSTVHILIPNYCSWWSGNETVYIPNL